MNAQSKIRPGAVFLAVMRKEFRHMLRDPWALAIVTVGALVLITLMAYTFSIDIEYVPMAAMDGDRSLQSRTYLERFANDTFFDLKYWARSDAEAREWVRTGRVRVALIIPRGFAEATLREEPVSVQLIVDGSEPNTAYQILGNAEALTANYTVELLEQRLTGVGLAPDPMLLDFRVRPLYNPDLKSIHAIMPGLMAIVLAMPALSAALSLAREREQGSLEALMATPIRHYQLLAGKVVPYMLVGLLDIFLFTLIGRAVFGVPLRGHLMDLILLSCLFLFANLGIGLLVSSLVRSQMAALIVAGLIFIMPPINESGIFYPLFAMPQDAQIQSMLWPATHYVIIARAIFLKGVRTSTLIPQGAFLLALGLMLNALAIWRLRKKIG